MYQKNDLILTLWIRRYIAFVTLAINELIFRRHEAKKIGSFSKKKPFVNSAKSGLVVLQNKK